MFRATVTWVSVRESESPPAALEPYTTATVRRPKLTRRLLTIYDLQFDAKWKGTTASGEEVTGKVSCPEFSHEQVDGLEDYQFQFSADGAEGEALLPYVKKALPPVLEEKLNSFRPELLQAHGMFVDSLSGSAPASGAATPAARSMQSYSPAPPGEVREKAPAAKKTEKVTSTASIEASVDLRASADDCWSLLTDPARVPMWSRSQAKIAPTPGAEFELFGGAVSGKVTEAQPPTKLVQTWNTKSPGWPADHYGTMTITLKQGSDSTNGEYLRRPQLSVDRSQANPQSRSSSRVSRPARRTTSSVRSTSSTSRGEYR